MEKTSIVVRLVGAKGEAIEIANVLLDVHFYMEDRYRYGFGLGRTEADGVVQTSLDKIQAELDKNRSLFLMDYITPLSECNDAIGIHAPTPDELTQRDVARLKWSPEDAPPAKTANHLVICGEQKFVLRRGAANDFTLVAQRL